MNSPALARDTWAAARQRDLVSGSAEVPGVCTPRIRAALEGPLREAKIVHRGPDAVYFYDPFYDPTQLQPWVLGVIGPRSVGVPCAVRINQTNQIDQIAELDLGEVNRVQLGDGSIILDQTTITPRRLIDLRLRLPGNPAETIPELLASAHRQLRKAEEIVIAELGDLGELLSQQNDAASIQAHLISQLGRGGGLTPLADDVLAGWIATGVALGCDAPVLDAYSRTTMFSATLLRHASYGEVIPPFADFCANRGSPRSAERLLAVGHTSGAGLLFGGCLRLINFLVQPQSQQPEENHG